MKQIHRYRIVSPIRFFFFILILMISLMLILSSFINHSSAEADAIDTYVQVSVTENDTLWNIAEKYAPKDKDIRLFIHDISEVNDINTGDTIKQGDILFVPVS